MTQGLFQASNDLYCKLSLQANALRYMPRLLLPQSAVLAVYEQLWLCIHSPVWHICFDAASTRTSRLNVLHRVGLLRVTT